MRIDSGGTAARLRGDRYSHPQIPKARHPSTGVQGSKEGIGPVPRRGEGRWLKRKRLREAGTTDAHKMGGKSGKRGELHRTRNEAAAALLQSRF